MKDNMKDKMKDNRKNERKDKIKDKIKDCRDRFYTDADLGMGKVWQLGRCLRKPLRQHNVVTLDKK